MPPIMVADCDRSCHFAGPGQNGNCKFKRYRQHSQRHMRAAADDGSEAGNYRKIYIDVKEVRG